MDKVRISKGKHVQAEWFTSRERDAKEIAEIAKAIAEAVEAAAKGRGK